MIGRYGPIQVRVMWRSLITGFAGNGSWLDVKLVCDVVISANKRYSHEIFHWAEFNY